jgi:hypothetical protein
LFTIILGLSVLNVFLDFFFLACLIGITETEAFPAIVPIVAGVGAILYFGFGVDVLTLVKSIEFSTYLFGAIAYVTFGIAWSTLKWWLYTRSMEDTVTFRWNEYKRLKDATVADFKKSAVYNPLYREGVSLTNANNWRIVNWAVMWPTSLVWTAIRGVTVDLGKVILTVFGRVYDGIAGGAYKGLS